MKQLCKRLTETTELITEESNFIPWLKGEWWRDRECSFAFDCTPRTTSSWNSYIRYMNSRSKTLRRHLQSRATKRLLPK
jgi:hypothetical protein